MSIATPITMIQLHWVTLPNMMSTMLNNSQLTTITMTPPFGKKEHRLNLRSKHLTDFDDLVVRRDVHRDADAVLVLVTVQVCHDRLLSN